MAVILLLSMLVACAQNGTPEETTEAPAVATTTAAEETTGEPEPLVPVEDLSVNGQATKFNMLVRKSRYAYLYTDEQNGELLNYAVYKRNTTLEEDYGISFSISEQSDATGFATAMKAATDEYDLACVDYWWNLELQGLFLDIAQMEEINVEDPWWYSGWNKNVTINGKMYTIAGDANLEMLENLEVVFFNKSIAKDLNLDLYKSVSDGKWTIEEMKTAISMAASGFDDADTTNDRYGLLIDLHSADAMLYSLGMKLSEFVDGEVSIDIASDQKNIDLTEALSAVIKTTGTKYVGTTARATDWTIFKNGTTLFYATALYIGQSMKSGNLDFDYGILPMPKLTEDAEYISTSYGVSVFGIPVTVASAHNSALIMNAMSYRSSGTDDSLVTTFYDVVLKYQIATSVEDVTNLDIVKNNVYIDFCFIYLSSIDKTLRDSAINGTSPSTPLKATVKTAKNTLKNSIIAFYQQ